MNINQVKNEIEDFFRNADVISSYTRKQALEDGVLIDVSPIAKEAGFKYPVAITSRVWGEVIVPPIEAQEFQDDIGRLWDMLTTLRMQIKRAKPGQGTIYFNFLVQQKKPGKTEKQCLKSACGPGDDAEPVITIMFPEED